MPDHAERLAQRRADHARSIENAGSSFVRLISKISYQRGHASSPREIAIARQKIDEAVMWALKVVR